MSMKIKQTQPLRLIVDGVIINRITRKQVDGGFFGLSKHRIAFEDVIAQMEAREEPICGMVSRVYLVGVSVDIQVDILS